MIDSHWFSLAINYPLLALSCRKLSATLAAINEARVRFVYEEDVSFRAYTFSALCFSVLNGFIFRSMFLHHLLCSVLFTPCLWCPDQGRAVPVRGLVVARAPGHPGYVQQALGHDRGLRAARADPRPAALRETHESVPDHLVFAPAAGDR